MEDIESRVNYLTGKVAALTSICFALVSLHPDRVDLMKALNGMMDEIAGTEDEKSSVAEGIREVLGVLEGAVLPHRRY